MVGIRSGNVPKISKEKIPGNCMSFLTHCQRSELACIMILGNVRSLCRVAICKLPRSRTFFF